MLRRIRQTLSATTIIAISDPTDPTAIKTHSRNAEAMVADLAKAIGS